MCTHRRTLHRLKLALEVLRLLLYHQLKQEDNLTHLSHEDGLPSTRA
jgi:hypothetical protein